MHMHITLKILFIKALFILVESDFQPYIVDGDDAEITSYPHSLHLGVNCKSSKYKSKGKWICGGSIVTNEFGLTAAHCLSGCSNYSEVTISAGHIKPLKGVVTSASSFIVHPDYVEMDRPHGYDVALIKFKDPLIFSSKIQRVAIMERLKLPEVAHLAGWGIVQESPNVEADRLKQLKQNVLSRERCVDLLIRLPTGTICGKNDKSYASAGDSGSALMFRGYIQIGIVAYRLPFMPKVTVYMDVTYYYKWITDEVNKMCSYLLFFLLYKTACDT